MYDAKSDFNDVTEVDISKLLSSVSLDVYNFKNLMQQCCNAADKLIL